MATLAQTGASGDDGDTGGEDKFERKVYTNVNESKIKVNEC